MGEQQIPQPGERYYYGKDKLYQIICMAAHTDTMEQMVVYQALFGAFSIYTCPLSAFKGFVRQSTIPNHSIPMKEVKETPVSNNGRYSEDVRNIPPENNHTEQQNRSSEKGKQNTLGDKESLVIEFLDANTYKRKLEILRGMKKYLDNKIINDLAVSLDVVVEEGDLDSRFHSLERCLLTLVKFECDRFR